MKDRARKILWFFGLWLLGVAAVGLLALLLKLAIQGIS